MGAEVRSHRKAVGGSKADAGEGRTRMVPSLPVGCWAVDGGEVCAETGFGGEGRGRDPEDLSHFFLEGGSVSPNTQPSDGREQVVFKLLGFEYRLSVSGGSSGPSWAAGLWRMLPLAGRCVPSAAGEPGTINDPFSERWAWYKKQTNNPDALPSHVAGFG